MQIVHGPAIQELDDAWWEEAGMGAYRPTAASYAYTKPADGDREVALVSVTDVEPLRRTLSNGVFNDSQESGTARERVTKLLRGFRAGDPIPPIALDHLEQTGEYCRQRRCA